MIIMIGIMTIILAALAVMALVTARLMAAEDMGITIPSAAIYMGGGNPTIIHLTASEAITPGDNVVNVSGSASTVEMCDAGDDEYIGTADLNANAALDNNNPLTHDFATGEVVPVIVGNCHVRKIADTAGVNKGNIVRIGAADGVECQDISTAANKYTIGRALTSATSGNAFACHQF